MHKLSQVGKTTLIRSLIRRYTKTTMTDIQGPVTVVTGKARRLTVIECPNDLGAMVDLAKVADLVLIMIDGSFGLEMVSLPALECVASKLTLRICRAGNVRSLVRYVLARSAQAHRHPHPS